MRNRFAGILMAAFIASPALAAPKTVETEIVFPLSNAEPWKAMLAHDGFLWTGNVRTADHPHQLIIIPNDGSAKTTLDFTHSVKYIRPAGKRRIVTFGFQSNGQGQVYSAWTFVEWTGSEFTTQTQRTGIEYVMDGIEHTSEGTFLSEPGSRQLYRYSNRRVSAWGDEISGPGEMRANGNNIWALERRSFELGDEGLVVFATTSPKMDRLPLSFPNGIKSIDIVPRSNALAVSQPLNKSVGFVDLSSKEFIGEVALKSEPSGIAGFGHCAVAVTEDHTVIFVDRRSLTVLETWDFSDMQPLHNRPQTVVVDTSAKAVYTRAAIPCWSCTQSQNSVLKLTDGTSTIFDDCLN